MNLFCFSEVLGESVVELFHRNLAITVSIEMSHQGVGFLVGNIDVHVAETVGEFLEINDFITVLIELGKQVNAIGLEGIEFGSTSLDLSDYSAERGFREDVTVVLHVLLGVLVS